MKNLPKPVGRQIDVLCLYPKGHYAILGTAGSGKTLLALMRSAYLSDPRTSTFGKTMLITYNKVLTNYFSQFSQGNRHLDVRTYARFSTGYLYRRGRLGDEETMDENSRKKYLIWRFYTHKQREEVLRKFDTTYLVDEIDWICDHGIRTEDQYLGTSRAGRHVALLEGPRRAIYSVLNDYRRYRASEGKKFDFRDIAIAVTDEMTIDQRPRMYKHIVIDEGQEFSPEMLRSLSLAIPPDGSLTFFGDLVQQTKGVRFKTNFKAANLAIIQPIWKFEYNYRNSPQITRFALEIAAQYYFPQEVDVVMPTNIVAGGPLPSLIRCSDSEKEIEYVATYASAESRTRTVGVICRTNHDITRIAQQLQSSYKWLKKENDFTWNVQSGLYLVNYHSAQGLEFDVVILPFCSSSNLPNPYAVQEMGMSAAMAEDGRFFYIAVTRAKSTLIVTYSNQPSELIPTQSANLQRFDYGF